MYNKRSKRTHVQLDREQAQHSTAAAAHTASASTAAALQEALQEALQRVAILERRSDDAEEERCELVMQLHAAQQHRAAAEEALAT
jgi:hypothetical protein